MKYLIHTVVSYDLLALVEADSAEQAEMKYQTSIYTAYQKNNPYVTQSISEVPEDYDLHEDAISKGYS